MFSSGTQVPRSHGEESITSYRQPTNLGYTKEKHEEEVLSSFSPAYHAETLSINQKHDSTHRQLRPRHIQLIGIGGTIGTALFVQIGHGLINGGPGSLFLAFTIWYVWHFHIIDESGCMGLVSYTVE